ncbi:MAG: peptide-methionine (S)-S-oxide reductase, partial [Candidatus Ranarchaeia archaeon]|jgi:peptide-methionine (S)-S-oxide reductase
LNRQKLWDASIVTLIEPLEFFYPAESYHKDYYKKHPKQAYCQAVIAPKISKLHQRYLSKLKAI